MANDTKSKWQKFGKVIKKKAGGVCVVVGDPNAKNQQYAYHVEFKITDASGKLLAQGKNGFLNVSDPRKRPGIKEEDAAKIPASLVSELFFVDNSDNS